MQKNIVLLSLLVTFSAAIIINGCSFSSSSNPTIPSLVNTLSPQDHQYKDKDQNPTPNPANPGSNETLTPSYSIDENGNVQWNVDMSDSGKEYIKGIGKHVGELKWLEVQIVYLKPFFYTSEGYAGYYINVPMEYVIRIRNTGNRTYKHLNISAIQEYYETGECNRWWYPHPQNAQFTKGQPLPGDSTRVWNDIEINPYSEIILKDTYTAPIQTCAGLDQTHLTIQHTNKGRALAAAMYYNPEAAVYCPPPPDVE